jgi:hypothetical protein
MNREQATQTIIVGAAFLLVISLAVFLILHL